MTADDERILNLLTKLSNIELQVGHLGGMVDSERGTLKRTTERIREEIAELGTELKDILYGKDRISGLVMEVDRLKQVISMVKWMGGVIGALVIKTIYDFFKK